jgi:glycosyltransferase involved in cell wall biosynthesis
VDPSWEPQEVEVFSAFLNRCARIFVQGEGIAKTFAESFRASRPIDVVPTMVPDEVRCQVSGVRCQMSEVGRQRSEHQTPGTKHQASQTNSRSPIPNLESRISNPPPHSGSALRFGIICRFTEQKGIKYILEALKMFREKHGEVHFVFAGQGPLEPMIRDFARMIAEKEKKELEQPPSPGRHGEPWKAAKGTNGRVGAESGRFSGDIDDSSAGAALPPHPPSFPSLSSVQNSSVRIIPVCTVVEVFKDLDVFVHPGLDDAMPVSIVESLMCGAPVIGSSVGATPELVRDGVEGFIVPPADAGAIFEAMDRFAAMGADELTRLRRAARARYEEKCTPARVGGQVAAIYRGVMEACR